MSTTLSSVLSKSGIALTPESSNKLFESGVFDCMFVKTVVPLKSTFYSLVNEFPHIGHCSLMVQMCKRFYLRNFAGKIVEICITYVNQIAVIAMRRITNNVTLRLSYTGLYFGVEKTGTRCICS